MIRTLFNKTIILIPHSYNRLNIMFSIYNFYLFILILALCSSIINYPDCTLSAESSFQLKYKGKRDIIDYTLYGKFQNLGTKKYRYILKKRRQLAKDVGEGIYPNNKVYKDPEYKKLNKKGLLNGSHWDYINTKNHKVNFYKWATCQESPGVKQYYTAMLFERLGLLYEAIKGYHAVAVHFPRTVSYTYWNSPIYLAPVALDRIEIICRRNPQLGLKLIKGRIIVEKGYDLKTMNDRFIINPGKIIKVPSHKVAEKKKKFSSKDIVKSMGGKNVRLVKYKNGHWQLLVNNKPYIIKAMAYSPNKIGLSPDRGTLAPNRDWQTQDFNKNGKIDGIFESWIDKNKNNKQDPDEKTINDAQLLKEMGCNTLRIYNHVMDKKLFHRLYKEYGFRIMIGDMAGGYAIGSGATWKDGTDYENPKQQETMLSHIKKMVLDHKDEPYTLLWILGNENVYGVGNNSDKKPEAFFNFIKKAVDLIHELDPNHPVAICNGDLKFLDIIAQHCPNIDIYGANAYRGDFGFGRSMFQNVLDMMDKPVIITEYGCSAIAEGYTDEEALAYQALYHKNNWEDIWYNSAGSGSGNALGGVIFEWIDEWWKANSDLPKSVQLQKKEWYASRSKTYKNLQPENQDTVPQFGAPFLDGWSYEEWYGLFSQGDGSHSPYLRVIRPSYEMYKKVWNEIE